MKICNERRVRQTKARNVILVKFSARKCIYYNLDWATIPTENTIFS